MNEITTWVWFVAGLLAGCAHATMLWRATRRLTAWSPVVGMLRLGLVATVLVLSALSGQILASAGGWAIGLSLWGGWLVTRYRDAADAPQRVHCRQR